MAEKTYVLLPSTHGTANVYIQPNPNQRIRIKHRRVDKAFLVYTFTDYDGITKTYRYKRGCKAIEQQEQIDKYKIPANAKFTQAERDAVRFSNGVLRTTDVTLQQFLESSPEYEEFWQPNKDGETRKCDEIPKPKFKLLDKAKDAQNRNNEWKNRLKAANAIEDLKNLEDAQDLLYKINGSFFTAPTTLIDCQNLLVDILDNADDDIVELIGSQNEKEEESIDDHLTILIGRAINKKVLSFDEEKDWVVKLKGGTPTRVKEISSAYQPEERRKLFAEFLASRDGKLLRESLEKEVGLAEKKKILEPQT